MVRSLNKKWKELLYAFSGFGPNLLMVLMGAYYTDAINPVALGTNSSYQAIMTGTCFILPAIFPILYAIAKAFDGIIDIPFAHITDTLKTKWGRRRPPIAICFIPMVLSFAFCWWPVGGPNNQVLNTIWIVFWALVFFSTYTMCMIAFYGSLSTTCENDAQRTRVSSYKSFFDTISYCIVYALVPLLLSVFKVNIDKFVFICLPFMCTMLIPLFLIKEGAKYGYPEDRGQKPQRIKLWESLKITFKNRTFVRWLIVNGCAFFGLQMFLSAMNSMIIGGMGFNGTEMAIINTCAFAPVPMMLYLFQKLRAKKGLRFTYQTCLVSFGISILSFFFASLFMTGGNKMIQYIIACVGGVAASWGIGAFFMASYLVPNQIASAEEKLTGKNHSAMYFAAQAVVSSIVGAIASSLVYENIKMLFIQKGSKGVVWAENIVDAATKFGGDAAQVFNLGTLLIPFIVFVCCMIGCVVAFRMPKDYTPMHVAKELQRQDPSIVIPKEFGVEEKVVDKREIIFVQVSLSILSGFLFGYIWQVVLFKRLKEQKVIKFAWLEWLLCSFVPFYSIYFMIKTNKQLKALNKEKGVDFKGHIVMDIVLGFMFPILPINILALSFTQHNVNQLVEATQEKIQENVTEENQEVKSDEKTKTTEETQEVVEVTEEQQEVVKETQSEETEENNG